MATHGLPAWPWANQPADDLPAAERLLLDTARLWAAEARRGAPPLPALRLLLAAEDAEAAAAPLDALLRIAEGRAAPPGLACPLHPRVTPDEADLLLACALAQRGARAEALAALARLLPPLSACAALPATLALGLALRRAGARLRGGLR